jgi:cytochrome P450
MPRQSVTQWDGLGHVGRGDRLYNACQRQKPHLGFGFGFGFGFGMHLCLGITLARREAPVASNACSDRFPNYPVVEPVHFNRFVLCGPGTLRITTG